MIARKLQLEEKKRQSSLGIDTRIKDGKWTKQITTYASGRTVTEYADKRRKTIEETKQSNIWFYDWCLCVNVYELHK